MGCWNKTCAMSNLPILHGMATYVFVIERQPLESRCYTTAMWAPVLLPFISTYDDYGSGERSEGPALSYVMGGVRDRLVEKAAGENQYHDIAVTRDGFDVTAFFTACGKNRLQVRGYSEPNDIDFVMMRKDVVDDVLATFNIEQYVGPGNGSTGWDNQYDEYGFTDVESEIVSFVHALSDIESPLLMFDWPIAQLSNGMRLAKVLCQDYHRYSRLADARDIVTELVKERKFDDAIAVMTEHVRALFIDMFMDSVRKVWIPACHEGSQAQEYGSYNVLATALTAAIQRDCVDDEDG